MSRPQAKRAQQPEVRLARLGDEAAIAKVLCEAFSLHRDGYTPEAFAAVTPDVEKIRIRFDQGPQWVAEMDNEIVGTASAFPEPGHLYIRSVGVVENAQGRGVATKLMMAIEEYARSVGEKKLFLHTTYFSTGAIELYDKLGFTKGRDTTADEWLGTPGLEMWKDLK